MGTLVSTLITRGRRRLNETSTTFHADADLIAYADEAQNYIVEKIRPLEESSTTTIDTSQTNPEQYSLPSDFLALQRVTLDGIDLFRTNFQEIKEAEIDTTDTTGDTYAYFEWNNVLHLFPVPGAAEDGKTLKLYYYKKSGTIDASTDTLDIGTEYDDAVICYMAYLAFIKDKEFDMADYMMTECNAKLVELKRQRAEDKLDRPPRFRLSDNLKMRDTLNAYRFRRRY